MKAVDMLLQYWEQLKRLPVYIQYCLGNNIQTPVCRDFWMWSVYISVVLGLLIAVILGKKIFKEQIQFYRNKKRLEARTIVADDETMEEVKWKGEDGGDNELSQEELAARMREAIKIQAELLAANAKKNA